MPLAPLRHLGMEGTGWGRPMSTLDDEAIARVLRQALRASAKRLKLDPASVASPAPGAVIARSREDELLRLDVHTYGATELVR